MERLGWREEARRMRSNDTKDGKMVKAAPIKGVPAGRRAGIEGRCCRSRADTKQEQCADGSSLLG
jgi:hypothetical protein